MYPSVLSTSSTLARIFEPGVETLGLARICALRMRVMRSLIGSCVDMDRPSLPARLYEPGNQALGAEFAQRDTGKLVLAIDRARTPGQFATVANPGRRRIARHFGELQRRRKPLFHRLCLVGDDGLQLRALGSGVLRHPLAPVVLLDRTLLCHAWLLMVPRLRGVLFRVSLPEREIECGQQCPSFVVESSGGAYRDVHAPRLARFVEVDFGENDVLLDAERIIAAAIEALRIEAAEVAHARQRHRHQAVD